MIAINEPDRIRATGITHRMELHGIVEDVYNYDYLTGKSDDEYTQRTAVDFRFVSSGYPSAMLHRDDVIAIQDWLSAFLEANPEPSDS